MTIIGSHRSGRPARTPRRGVPRAALVVVTALLPVFAVLGAASPVGAGNGVATGDDTPKITLCHATNSDTNPYVVITVDSSSVITQGHDGHTGPIWNATLKDQKIDWGDVIPSFTYVDKNDATRTYPGMNTDALVLIANECQFVTVQPIEPTVTQSTTCDVEGTYTIPATTGVTYKLDGTVIAAGTYPGPKTATITAEPKPGYLLSDPTWSFALVLPAAAVCPVATPVGPTVVPSTICEVEGSYTIPATTGITYQLDGVAIAAGTYPGPVSGVVTAEPVGDYVLSDPTWSFTLSVPAAAVCPQEVPVVVTPVAPTVTPSTICEIQGSYTIPATAGVTYYLDGTALTAREYPGPASGLVTAKADEGYTLSDPTWSYPLSVPAAEICAADAPTSDTPAVDAPTAEPTSALPKTGAPASALVAAGALALLLGLSMLAIGSRRPRADLS
jgi:LPXTG-motif cell wall-anchored protein